MEFRSAVLDSVLVGPRAPIVYCSCSPQVEHALLDNGKTQNAIAIFKAKLHQCRKSASAYDGIGEACLRSGQKVIAIESYKNALKLDPHDQNATEAPRNLKQD
jgi:tetratricopeptide (TPR) repeat protein